MVTDLIEIAWVLGAGGLILGAFAGRWLRKTATGGKLTTVLVGLLVGLLAGIGGVLIIVHRPRPLTLLPFRFLYS